MNFAKLELNISFKLLLKSFKTKAKPIDKIPNTSAALAKICILLSKKIGIGILSRFIEIPKIQATIKGFLKIDSKKYLIFIFDES